MANRIPLVVDTTDKKIKELQEQINNPLQKIREVGVI